MKEKVRSLMLFSIPIIACLLLLVSYNFLRFHNLLDNGYSTQVQSNSIMTNTGKYGFWGISHMPTNFYYIFIKSPESITIPGTMVFKFPFITYNPWGLSILFTSPMLLWLLKAPFKNREVFYASITSLVILIFLLGWYGTGYSQYGDRYTLDFYPFLLLILAYAVKNGPSGLFKATISASWFFNFYLLLTK